MIRNAVQLAAHANDRPTRRDFVAEDFGAIGLGEDRLGHVLADLAPVNVPGGDHLNVAGTVAPHFAVHKSDRLVRAGPIVGETLDQGAGAVSDAHYRYVYARH